MTNRQPTNQLVKLLAAGTKTVLVQGWVNSRRDHGGLIFIDLRDHWGLIQLVCQPDNKSVFAQAQQLRDEWVIEVGGQLVHRQPDLINQRLANGQLEIIVNQLRVLNQSLTPPIPIDGQTTASEDKRLRYRFLDLRRPQLQQALKDRARFYRYLRDFMEANSFTEVPTPILANSSPEGARDFVVPSRLHQGQFYALPQAPQQFKQLLMVGGLDRYYQIAACFRDEDPRADRLYGDFYQLDLEVAFVEDGQLIRDLLEPLIVGLIVDFAGLKLHRGKIGVMSYQQALADYGTDKPDLRFGLTLVDLAPVFAQTTIDVFKVGLQEPDCSLKGLVANRQFSRNQIKVFTDKALNLGAKGLAQLSFVDDQFTGPLAKLLTDQERTELYNQLKLQNGASLFVVADQTKIVNRVLAALRVDIGHQLDLIDDRSVAACWITDFPFFELDDTGQLSFAHNPFSRPLTEPVVGNQVANLAIVADQYDLVLNGYEVCSGAIRNHQPDSLERAFRAVGHQPADIKRQFGGLIEALAYGAPPHGGCAFGLDRLLMVLSGETNIRNLVAFPKNGAGVDLLMGSPGPVDPAELKQLGFQGAPLKRDR